MRYLSNIILLSSTLLTSSVYTQTNLLDPVSTSNSTYNGICQQNNSYIGPYGYNGTTTDISTGSKPCITNNTNSNSTSLLIQPGDSQLNTTVSQNSLTISGGKPGDDTSSLTILEPNSVTDPPVQLTTSNNPTAIRISYADTTDSAGITIGWTTANTLSNQPTVLWNGATTYTGTTQHYTGVGYFHYVTIYGLTHDTQYTYQIVADTGSNSAASDVYTIKTSREASNNTPFTMAMVGDFGLASGTDTHDALIRDSDLYDFITHIGDISYADDCMYDS